MNWKIALIILAAIPAGLTLLHMRLYVRRHGLGWLVIRFATGQHLDGQRKTNATFLHAGKRAPNSSRYISGYAHKPDVFRMGMRWGGLLFIILTGYGLLRHRNVTLDSLIGLATAGLIFGAFASLRGMKGHHHAKTLHNPLSEAMAPLLGVTTSVIDDALQVNPSYTSTKSGENIATLVLPDEFAANPAQKESVENLFANRIGVEIKFQWHTSKFPQYVTVTRAPIPPKLVKWVDVLSIVKSMAYDHILLGINGSGQLIEWDLTSEEPAVAIQATSRRGKTRLLLLILAQLFFQGAEHATLIDPKRVGLDEAMAGVNGVHVYSNPKRVDEMWRGIRNVRKIMDDRIDALAEDRTLTFRNAVLVIDEVSMASSMFKVYWDSIRDPRTTKATPEIWQDVAAICWEGAQVAVRCIVAGQRLEASTLGGMLESFGCRMLAGYQKRGYDRLVGINPMPPAQKARGRFLHYDGENLNWIQVVLGSDQEFRDHALAGQRSTVKPTLDEVIERMEA